DPWSNFPALAGSGPWEAQEAPVSATWGGKTAKLHHVLALPALGRLLRTQRGGAAGPPVGIIDVLVLVHLR
ncbi:MAG: hypothetical protein QOC98_921, partial [Frankiaceae bacterium]|nr:hypothetical protein [Frankiaceae bacterium]